MKIIGIVGEPAIGKTTLMRSVIATLDHDNMARYEFGLLKGYFFKPSTYVLGIYDNQTFCGTDRLSMAVLPVAIRWAIIFANLPGVTLWEGDRLYNSAFLEAMKDQGGRIVRLTAPDGELKRRHAARGDKQNESWLKGRKTKDQRLSREFESIVTTFTDPDLARQFILSELELERATEATP